MRPMCLLGKIIWPTEEMIKHRQGMLNDALFLVGKQCEPPGNQIDLPAIQGLKKRSPLLGDRDSDTPAIMGCIHFA